MKTIHPATLAAALWLGLSALPARAAFDAFLSFSEPQTGAKKIEGESQDEQFPGAKGWFPIISFDQSIQNPTTIGSATGGAGAGKVVFRDFNFTKAADAASANLFATLASGAHFKKAYLVLRQPGAQAGALRRPFYTVVMDTVFIKNINWSATAGDDFPEEMVSTVYGSLQWILTRFDEQGAPATTVTVNWDQIKNLGGEGLLSSITRPTLSYPAFQKALGGGSLDVAPDAGPSDPTGISTITVKSKGGYTGGIVVNAEGVVQLTDAQPPGGPYTITIETANNLGVRPLATFNLSVGSTPAPLAIDDLTHRALGETIQIPIATLLSNDSPDTTFDGLPTSTTTLGGQITFSANTGAITYQPPNPDPGATDTFTYRIRDTAGQTSVGTVAIHLTAPNNIPLGNLTIGISERGATLLLTGPANAIYQLQTASAIEGPWANLGLPAAASADGIVEWTDPNPESPRFYRTSSAP